MDGFRVTLEKAIRDNNDDACNNTNYSSNDNMEEHDAYHQHDENGWKSHTVDYQRFKQRLKFFARRRAQIRTMIRSSPDGHLSEQMLIDLLGPKTGFPAKKMGGDVPLSQNLSVDAHAHIGMARSSNNHHPNSTTPNSLPGVVRVSTNSQEDADYVALTDQPSNVNNNDTTFEEEASHASSSGGNPFQRRRNQRSIMRRLSISERNEIFVFLEWEMDKVLMFYLAQWQRLSQELEVRQQHQQQYGGMGVSSATHSNDTNNNQYNVMDTDLEYKAGATGNAAISTTPTIDTDLGDEILELVAFCVINVVAAQQILVRYDAFARAYEGTPMLTFYMKQVTESPTSFRKILHHTEVRTIAAAYTAALSGEATRNTLQQHQQQRQPESHVLPHIQQIPSPSQQQQRSQYLQPYLSHFEAQLAMFEDILSALQSTDSLKARDNVSVADAFMYGVRKLFLVGLFEDRLGLEPAYLTARGQSLTSEMDRLVQWRKKKHDISLSRRKPKEKKLSGMQIFNLTLNLLAAFLYCMNYYIVEPSSTMYVNRLGAHDAMSGTLIGMMPLAAFVSSIPYSMWTNRSFRHPFIMSSSMMVVGNLLYSMADQFGVVWVALLGRFIAGLGAPKCIIRRYMADTTPVSLRTGVNAGFGMVVAAGSAMGPAMAIVLNNFEHTLYVRNLGLVTLNGLTLPGYFMACLWFTFGLIVVTTFEEPDREGLKEQQELEAKRAILSSTSTVSAASSTHNNTDDNMTIFSGESAGMSDHQVDWEETSRLPKWIIKVRRFIDLVTLPVRLCMLLLFCKVFTIESLVSATSSLSKNRYRWQVQQVGTLGLTCGLLVIPFSILIGRLSMSYQDHLLMKWLVSVGCFGMFLLVDLSDLGSAPTASYNEGHVLAVSPVRYVMGYFMVYLSIQSFEGVIGSTLSKVIPTALASGTFNSGLLATLVDTFGRTCGDLFISAAGFINIRQLINLLFIPGFAILFSCLVIIQRYRDMLSV